MNDYLLRHAIDNVWCNLGQDRQFQYELRQLTPKYGTRKNYVVEYEKYDLPYETEKDWFHVFQIGQIVPSALALPKTYNTWMSLEYLAKEHKMLGEVYVGNGIQFPRAQTWVLITPTQNLLVAVKILPKFPSMDETKPYLHFYQNAFFHSKRSTTSTQSHFVEARTLLPKTTEELRQFQIRIMDYLALRPGSVPLYWVNGRFVHEISLVTAGVGDWCEFILDTSIYRVQEYTMKTLPTFNSTLDTETKYILHLPKSVQTSTIEFYDDLSVFLCKSNPALGRFSGISYHHNEGNWLRQLTHRDWSLPVSRCEQFIALHPEDPRHATDPIRWPTDLWTVNDPMVIRVYHRRSGYERPLIAESSRIQELYRLKDDDIIRAMTGADSVPVWQAANLEKAPYVQFMSANPKIIFPIAFQVPDKFTTPKDDAINFAGDVYGYHESAHLLANNPSKVYNDQGSLVADLAYNYWTDATVFEYDSTGVLIDYYYHTAGRRYSVHNANCTMVEAVTGHGSNNLDGKYGLDPVDISGGYGYRVYVTPVWAGEPTGEWIDITDLPNRADWGFEDTTGDTPVWRWLAQANQWKGLVRRDHRFYMETYQFNKTTGWIQFSFRHEKTEGGETVSTLMEIPFGQLDVFLNNRPLIENLDYVIIPGNTFAETKVVLCNLEYLDDLNTVLIRGTGFCSPDLQLWAPTEFGFVEYGVLSGNAVYDIHTHKMQRIIIDGHYRDFKDVKFEEDFADLVIQDERNGAPYQIQTPQPSFRDVYQPDMAARVKDDAIDKQVSDYMTEYFPQRPRPNPDQIPVHYHVFSVYANKILHEIVKGTLKPPLVNGFYSEMDIARVTAQYDWLKPFDMCNREYNTNHVKVYPHWLPDPVGVTIQEYDFFVRILKMNLRVVPDLAPFIYITRT
jgi:hypothetical protein